MKFSDEMINAYADGELQGSEKAEFESALQKDAELQCALDDVVSLKAQLRSAYDSVQLPSQEQVKKANYRVAAYAGFLLLAFSGGWISSAMIPQQAPVIETVYQEDGYSGIRAASVQQPGKYILHIGSHDDAKFKYILDKAEYLMTHYQDDMQLIELEIIANAEGLDLLREDASPFAQRVKDLSQRYPKIKFIACSNAIERMREKGIEPNLINAVHQGPTALDQVVKRMNDGWTYIKI